MGAPGEEREGTRPLEGVFRADGGRMMHWEVFLSWDRIVARWWEGEAFHWQDKRRYAPTDGCVSEPK